MFIKVLSIAHLGARELLSHDFVCVCVCVCVIFTQVHMGAHTWPHKCGPEEDVKYPALSFSTIFP